MHSITNLIQLCYKRTFSITTLMKSFFLVPYSSNMPRGAAAGTKRMDLKVTSPSAVKWMWERGSSVSWGGGGEKGGGAVPPRFWALKKALKFKTNTFFNIKNPLSGEGF